MAITHTHTPTNQNSLTLFVPPVNKSIVSLNCMSFYRDKKYYGTTQIHLHYMCKTNVCVNDQNCDADARKTSSYLGDFVSESSSGSSFCPSYCCTRALTLQHGLSISLATRLPWLQKVGFQHSMLYTNRSISWKYILWTTKSLQSHSLHFLFTNCNVNIYVIHLQITFIVLCQCSEEFAIILFKYWRKLCLNYAEKVVELV